MSEPLYPTTMDALAKAQDYKQNFMNLSLPRRDWWHKYPFNSDFYIKVTWGKNNYFFVYGLWSHAVETSDPEDLGWDTGKIKPYKAWIFMYNTGMLAWDTIYDADDLLWSEDSFTAQRKTIKALP